MVACKSCEEQPVDLEPRSFDAELRPESFLTMESLDSLVPGWSDAHTAWLIEWEGARAARLKVERYQRGECFIQARYYYVGDGELRKTNVLFLAGKEDAEGREATIDDAVLARLLRELSEERSPWSHRQDAAGRLVWAHRVLEAEEKESPGIELMGSVTYDREPCILRPILRSRDVPAKQTPASRDE